MTRPASYQSRNMGRSCMECFWCRATYRDEWCCTHGETEVLVPKDRGAYILFMDKRRVDQEDTCDEWSYDGKDAK